MRVNLDPLVVTGKTSVWALLFASLALGLFTSIAMYKVGVPNVSLGSILLISGGWLVVLTNGVCVQKALAPALDDVDLTFALAVGIVCSSIVVLALTEIFQIPSAIGLMALCFFILFFVFFLRRHFTLRLSNLGLDALVVPCCITFVLVWCWSSLTSLGELPKKGTISMWTDIFVHATTILQYGDFWTSSRSSIELANTPRPLYHYGSYVLPAALFSAIDISGLQSAVAVHLPIGLLAMFAGTYALAKQITTPLRSKITALLSISLLFIAPDTSTYGLANGWFGVRWMLFSSPGSGYAVAAVLISLLFLNAWLNDRNYVALISAVVFAAMAFQLRVHMLLWYLPALILYVGSSCLKRIEHR